MKAEKKKAEELTDKYVELSTIKGGTWGYPTSKQLAMIHCKGIIDELFDFREQATTYNNKRIKFWQGVHKILEEN